MTVRHSWGSIPRLPARHRSAMRGTLRLLELTTSTGNGSRTVEVEGPEPDTDRAKAPERCARPTNDVDAIDIFQQCVLQPSKHRRTGCYKRCDYRLAPVESRR